MEHVVAMGVLVQDRFGERNGNPEFVAAGSRLLVRHEESAPYVTATTLDGVEIDNLPLDGYQVVAVAVGYSAETVLVAEVETMMLDDEADKMSCLLILKGWTVTGEPHEMRLVLDREHVGDLMDDVAEGLGLNKT